MKKSAVRGKEHLLCASQALSQSWFLNPGGHCRIPVCGREENLGQDVRAQPEATATPFRFLQVYPPAVFFSV